MKLLKKIALAIGLLSTSVLAAPVDDFGHLSVNGTRMVGEDGNPAILRGMSLFWNNWNDDGNYWNENVVKNLAEDWNMNVIRAAMGASGSDGQSHYDGIHSKDVQDVEKIVDAAIEAGIYVLIDWHGHKADTEKEKAIEFFTYMAKKYGKEPNVLFEIWNEPVSDGSDEATTAHWNNSIKPYAEEVIAAIRQHSKNIIIVGTPLYCQRLDVAAKNQIAGENIMYTLHVYVNSHWKSDWTMNCIKGGIDRIPVFVTEWGTCDADGAGQVNTTYAKEFLDWIYEKGISSCNWSIYSKAEAASALKPGTSTDGNWTENDLTESGKFVFNDFKTRNAPYTPPETGKNTAPVLTVSKTVYSITVGESFTPKTDIDFSATDDEDGDLTKSVVITGTVNTAKVGEYTLTLTVTDKDGGKDTETVLVKVIAANSNEKPVITVQDTIKVKKGTDWSNSLLLCGATDHEDGDLTSSVKITGTVDTKTVGSYKLTLTVKDSDNNTVTKICIVKVEEAETSTNPGTGFVLIDDFENKMGDADNQTYLGARFNTSEFTDAGAWWAFDDSKENNGAGNSSATPNYIEDPDFESGLSTDAKNGSQALKLNIKLDPNAYEYAFYGVGFNLTEEGVYSDLSKLTKVTFWAKGSGTMKFVMQTKEALEDFASDWGHYESEFVLSSSWTQIEIPVTEFWPSAHSDLLSDGKGFAKAKNAVSKIQFQTVGQTETNITFAVDDIRFYGMDYSDFEWDDHKDNGGKVPALAPKAEAIEVETDEDKKATIALKADGGTISGYEIGTEPKNGSVSISGSVATYIPKADFYGEDEFTYIAKNSDGLESKPAKVTITVNSVNDGAPVVSDLTLTVNKGESEEVTLSATDDGTIEKYEVSIPANGTAKLVGKVVTYTPNTNFVGKDEFTYTVTDNDGAKSTAKVSVTVLNANSIPTADAKTATVDEDASVEITLSGKDTDGTIKSYAIATQPKNGTVALNGNKVTYTPKADYFGSDEFTFTVTDDSSAISQPAKVSITVNSVNDGAPTANAFTEALEIENDSIAEFTLSGSDKNEFEKVVGIKITKQPENGTITVDGLKVKYTPNEGYVGEDTFSYKVIDNDGIESENEESLTISVAPVSIIDEVAQENYNSDKLVVGPMPLTIKSKVFYIVEGAGVYTLELYNRSEQLMAKTTVEAKDGRNVADWSALKMLPKGVYYIALKQAGKFVTLTRIVK